MDNENVIQQGNGYKCPCCNNHQDEADNILFIGEWYQATIDDPNYAWVEVIDCSCGQVYWIENGC